MAGRRRASSPFNPLGSLVFTAGVVALGVVLYATTQLLTEPMPERWLGSPPPLAEESADVPLAERITAVTKRLEKGPLRLATPQVQAQGSGQMRYEHRLYQVVLPERDDRPLRAALDLARGQDVAIVTGIEPTETGARGEVGVDGLLTHTIVAVWAVQPTPAPPRVALVIDDMGNSLLAARDLLSLPYPVALAVIPFRPFSREVAESANQRGREILLHLPMEAKGGEENGEVELLRVADNANQVVEVVDRSLAAVPHVVGVNNHMGSRFTEDPDRMRLVLERLRQRNLFFLDSLTTPHSVGRSVAESLGVPYVARSVFLDDNVEQAAIAEQLQSLLAAARKDGQAVGIGHPYPETLALLRDFGDAAKAAGVQIVPLSELVAR